MNAYLLAVSLFLLLSFYAICFSDKKWMALDANYTMYKVDYIYTV